MASPTTIATQARTHQGAPPRRLKRASRTSESTMSPNKPKANTAAAKGLTHIQDRTQTCRRSTSKPAMSKEDPRSLLQEVGMKAIKETKASNRPETRKGRVKAKGQGGDPKQGPACAPRSRPHGGPEVGHIHPPDEGRERAQVPDPGHQNM